MNDTLVRVLALLDEASQQFVLADAHFGMESVRRRADAESQLENARHIVALKAIELERYGATRRQEERALGALWVLLNNRWASSQIKAEQAYIVAYALLMTTKEEAAA